jgi:LPXTG-motif cell wall-anchored protein
MDAFINWLPFIGSIVVAFLGYFFGKRKNNADIVTEVSEAARKLIQPLNCRIDELEKELKPLRPLPAKVKSLQNGIDILIKQLKRNRIEPEWTPAMADTITVRR